MPSTYTKRDRETARATHRLFWETLWQDKAAFFLWLVTRPPALLIYNVLVPFQIAYGLQAIITRHFDDVTHYALTVLLLSLAYCVLWAIGGVAIIRNGEVGMKYIQHRIFANYLNKDYEFLNSTFLGSLGTQAARLQQTRIEYDQTIFNGFVKQVIVVVTSIAIIAYQSPVLAFVTLLSMILVLGFTIAMSKWRLKYRRLLSEAASETAGVISDALSHGSTVKSFAAEEYEEKRLNLSMQQLAKTQYWSWMTSIPADVGRAILAASATFLLLIMTARLYQHHKISIAIVVLVQLYVIKLVMATHDIADLIKTYESIMSSAHQAVKTMLIASTVLDKPQVRKFPRNPDYGIELKRVTFRYNDAPEGITAVKNFSLKIAPGERVGLVGYSGSGKTTLTKLLLRFMDVTEGSISISGVDIRELAQKDLRSVIAYVPQEPLLFHRSIAENIAYGRPSASMKDWQAAGRAAYVHEFTKELKNGYDTLVGEKGVKLSGGQRQRVALARALLRDAPILILDEATSALDSRSEKYIQKALWKLMKDRTAIVIAHRLSTIQRLDRIVVMDKGRIVEEGTHQQLLEMSGVYAKLWQHESGGYLPITTNARPTNLA